MSSDYSFIESGEKPHKNVQKILIADDQDKNRYFLEVLLEGNGYLVTSVENGQDALDLLKLEPFDGIISDILMPILDGFKLCRIINTDPELAQIPFIFYTASFTETKARKFGLSIGADEYIIKPVEPDILLAIIRDVLERVKQEKKDGKKKILPDDLSFYARYAEVLGGE